MDNEEQVEVSFTRMWDPSLEGKYVPLNIDKRSLLNSYKVFAFISLSQLQIYFRIQACSI